MQQLNKSAHSTHTLNFHLIFVTKYRRSVLTHQIGDRIKEICQEIAKEQNCNIVAVETEVDHLHIMLELKPTHSIPKLVQFFKGRSSRICFLEFPHLKKRLWGGHLWSPSYFVTTAGGAPLETLKNYVECQRIK
jgi:putative transposase